MFDKAGRHKDRQADRKADLGSTGLADPGRPKWHKTGNNEEISCFEELNVLSAK
jgi:hypothetical protein